ncbi:MAG: phosphoribosylglycinamide formyltransferase [Verrucomicrobiae bacterium]|nr:phosphoribosylglycinamide formyltransferase [Verrucomicrobiae bacterium]NNJ43670.1 phosphoribosylglycinamide formyltransferase [Akkermansiaceae bacterium]
MSTGHQTLKLGVLGSGSGSNMQAILDAIGNGTLDAEIVLVLSDNPEAYILKRAEMAGIATEVIDCDGYVTRFPDDSQVAVGQMLRDAGVDLVCLAGFMRIVKAPLLEMFPERLLNIHPSLLPAYPGLRAWGQAVSDGANESGCTVHYVDAGMDTGPIILQSSVPVLAGDSAETLHARIQLEEHQLYPAAIRKVWAKLQSES